MSFNHKQKEHVRTYLLGTMPAPEARAFEERYFKDRAFFLWVQGVEVTLIEDYLNGKLPPEKAQIFETHYFHAAPLRARFEEVRGKHDQKSSVRRRLSALKWAPLAALALACLGAGLYWAIVRSKVASQTGAQVARNIPPAVRVQLVPGIQQGGNSMMAEVQIPAKQAVIEFDLEVPGRAAPFQCSASISEIGADGGLRRIWDAPSPIRSSAKGNTQQVTFQLDSSLLHHGDYRVDVQMADGSAAAAYIFRAISSPQTNEEAPRHD